MPTFDYTRANAYFITICTKNRACLFGNIANDEVVLSDLGRLTASCWQEIPLHFPSVILDEFIVMPNHVHGIIFLTGNAGEQFTVPKPAQDRQTGAINRAPTLREIPDTTSTEIPNAVGAQFIAPETTPSPEMGAINRAPTLGEIPDTTSTEIPNAVGAQFIAPRTTPSPETGAINRAPALGEIVRAYKARVSRAAGFSPWQRNYHEHVIRDESSLQRIREYVINNPAQWAMDSENPDRYIRK